MLYLDKDDRGINQCRVTAIIASYYNTHRGSTNIHLKVQIPGKYVEIINYENTPFRIRIKMKYIINQS